MEIVLTQADYDAAVLAGSNPVLLDIASVTGNVTIAFGAVLGVVALMYGLRKIYVTITRS